MLNTQKIAGVDGVRALACLMVMCLHAVEIFLPQGHWPNEIRRFFLTGSSGVAAFFVLSGFLLAMPFWKAWKSESGLPSLKTYTLRRFARIAPAFWFNLTLCFVLSWYFVPDAPYRIWRYLAGLTFTAGFTWQTFFPAELNGPLWSIGFEVISYALLALLASLWFRWNKPRSTKNGLIFWLAVFGAVLVIHQMILIFGKTDGQNSGFAYGFVGGAKEWWPAYNPVGFFAVFTIGILGAGLADWLSRSRLLAEKRFPLIADLVIALAFLCLQLLLWADREFSTFAFSFPRQPYSFPLLPALIAVILIFAPHSFLLRKFLDNRVLRFLSAISYGLYIWHYFLLHFLHRFWNGSQMFTDFKDWGLFVLLAYGLAGLLATVSWFFLEKPLVQWSQRPGKPANPA